MERKPQEWGRKVKLLSFKIIENFGQSLPAIPGAKFLLSSPLDHCPGGRILWLEMDIVENKEEPGESIRWRAQGQEEGMEKFLQLCAE